MVHGKTATSNFCLLLTPWKPRLERFYGELSGEHSTEYMVNVSLVYDNQHTDHSH